jgi:hypothetical protein
MNINEREVLKSDLTTYNLNEFILHGIQNSTFQKTATWSFLQRKGYIDRIQSMGHQYEQSC